MLWGVWVSEAEAACRLEVLGDESERCVGRCGEEEGLVGCMHVDDGHPSTNQSAPCRLHALATGTHPRKTTAWSVFAMPGCGGEVSWWWWVWFGCGSSLGSSQATDWGGPASFLPAPGPKRTRQHTQASNHTDARTHAHARKRGVWAWLAPLPPPPREPPPQLGTG